MFADIFANEELWVMVVSLSSFLILSQNKILRQPSVLYILLPKRHTFYVLILMVLISVLLTFGQLSFFQLFRPKHFQSCACNLTLTSGVFRPQKNSNSRWEPILSTHLTNLDKPNLFSFENNKSLGVSLVSILVMWINKKYKKLQ